MRSRAQTSWCLIEDAISGAIEVESTTMLELGYDYASCIKNSEKVSWRLDDVLPEGTPLDFGRPFLPESLAPTKDLDFLSEEERRKLNQIAGKAYLNLFAFVEEYILATMMQHAHAEMFGDPEAMRALVRFVDEELKHQQLFERYKRSFDAGFGAPVPVLESAVEVANVIMSHSPMAVMLVTLHIELMTQQHYVEGVKDDEGLDPLFKSLLKHHWLEEAQHARIDALELDKLARVAASEAHGKAVDEYFGILEAFDGLLAQQADTDVGALGAVVGRELSDAEAARVRAAQLAGYRRTFLHSGLTNKTFRGLIGRLAPDAEARAGVRAEIYA